MVWSTTITDVLNMWAQQGVFSYVIPFLLIFAVVYGVLAKIKIFEDNRAVNAIIALAIGLLAIQFDFVSTFFATIFPRFGIGLAVALVIVILMGIFAKEIPDGFKWMGLGLGVAVALWAISQWDWWLDSWGVGQFFAENFWALIIGGLVVTAIVLIAKSGGSPKPAKKE